MRTTLTIEPDVAFGLQELQKAEPTRSFKSLVNETLRRGLQKEPMKTKNKPFKVHARNLGLRKDIDWNNIEEALDIVEGVHRS